MSRSTGLSVALSGSAVLAAEHTVPRLVSEKIASGIAGHDATLWGPDAESEATIRLGWTSAATAARPLVSEITALREALRAVGIRHIVLGGMGGSSLAPEVITRTAGVELTVLDSTEPGQVLAALNDRLVETAVVISSKSGSTVETDSQRRAYEAAFTAAGIDPAERIVIVTDPGSPLEASAREAGYRVFNADPNVGGRFSALTAFGLVPSGLAGANISALLDEAEAVEEILSADSEQNPALRLAAAMLGGDVRHDKFGIVPGDSPIIGFGDWVEQLIAESTGKLGTGVLPVVLEADAPELQSTPADLSLAWIVADTNSTDLGNKAGEIAVSGPLGAQFLLWEYATVIAGRLLGINPFDQPDVEAAKVAARSLLEARPEQAPAAFTEDGVEVRGSAELLNGVSTLRGALDALLATLGPEGYLSVQAYLNRVSVPKFAELRPQLAARTGRPVTFGWGPRFLHSTGQFHKGGPAVGVFLQLSADASEDLAIPERPFSFGQLIQAQAQGDASVLAEHGRPVLRLHLSDAAAGLAAITAALG